MGVSKRLSEFLEKGQVWYGDIPHERASTSTGSAIAEHVFPEEHAKVVIVKADGHYIMAVLPANKRLSLLKLRGALGAETVRIAYEEEIFNLFEDCEVGAMPPFGNLYGIPVWVDESLAQDAVIVFKAGTHIDSIQMSYGDYIRLVNPNVADLAA